MAQAGCGVAQIEGAVWLRLGCGVAQIVEHRLAVRQAVFSFYSMYICTCKVSKLDCRNSPQSHYISIM